MTLTQLKALISADLAKMEKKASALVLQEGHGIEAIEAANVAIGYRNALFWIGKLKEDDDGQEDSE